jgi:hypothetical protein
MSPTRMPQISIGVAVGSFISNLKNWIPRVSSWIPIFRPTSVHRKSFILIDPVVLSVSPVHVIYTTPTQTPKTKKVFVMSH